MKYITFGDIREEGCVSEEFNLSVYRDKETNVVRSITITKGHPDDRGRSRYYSPPDGRPGEVDFDEQGRPERWVWYDEEGYTHRDNGPAIIRTYPETGVVIYEGYMKHGQYHRSATEPAFTERDMITGEITETGYYLDGKELPAPTHTPPSSPLRLDL